MHPLDVLLNLPASSCFAALKQVKLYNTYHTITKHYSFPHKKITWWVIFIPETAITKPQITEFYKKLKPVISYKQENYYLNVPPETKFYKDDKGSIYLIFTYNYKETLDETTE